MAAVHEEEVEGEEAWWRSRAGGAVVVVVVAVSSAASLPLTSRQQSTGRSGGAWVPTEMTKASKSSESSNYLSEEQREKERFERSKNCIEEQQVNKETIVGSEVEDKQNKEDLGNANKECEEAEKMEKREVDMLEPEELGSDEQFGEEGQGLETANYEQKVDKYSVAGAEAEEEKYTEDFEDEDQCMDEEEKVEKVEVNMIGPEEEVGLREDVQGSVAETEAEDEQYTEEFEDDDDINKEQKVEEEVDMVGLEGMGDSEQVADLQCLEAIEDELEDGEESVVRVEAEDEQYAEEFETEEQQVDEESIAVAEAETEQYTEEFEDEDENVEVEKKAYGVDLEATEYEQVYEETIPGAEAANETSSLIKRKRLADVAKIKIGSKTAISVHSPPSDVQGKFGNVVACQGIGSSSKKRCSRWDEPSKREQKDRDDDPEGIERKRARWHKILFGDFPFSEVQGKFGNVVARQSIGSSSKKRCSRWDEPSKRGQKDGDDDPEGIERKRARWHKILFGDFPPSEVQGKFGNVVVRQSIGSSSKKRCSRWDAPSEGGQNDGDDDPEGIKRKRARWYKILFGDSP